MALPTTLQRFKTGEAARFLGCTNRTILNYAQRGDLRCFHLASGRYEFDITDLAALQDLIRSRGPRRGRPMIGPAIAAKRAALAVEAVKLITGGSDNATRPSAR